MLFGIPRSSRSPGEGLATPTQRPHRDLGMEGELVLLGMLEIPDQVLG